MSQEQENKGYCERRAEEERAAAERCDDERAAQSHRELAARFDDLAASSGTGAHDGDEPPPHQAGILPPDFTILP